MSALSRQNLLLAGGLLALGLWLWWTGTAPPPATPARLSDLDPAGVSQIRIRAPDGPFHIALQQGTAGWRLQQPIQAPADPLSIDQILALPTQPVSARYEAAELDLADLGLAPARWQLSLDGQDFAVGDTEALSGARYVLHAGRVHLVAELPLERFDLDHADLVDRALCPPGITAVITPRGRLSEPGLLARWENTRALWLDRATRDDHAADGSSIRVELTGGGHIDFIRLQDGLLRPDWDLVYRLPASAWAELLPADA